MNKLIKEARKKSNTEAREVIHSFNFPYFYIDIGNTLIKILGVNKERNVLKILSFPVLDNSLREFFNLNKNAHIYISSSNLSKWINFLVSKLTKKMKNVFIFNPLDYPEDFQLPDSFKKSEVGKDIWLLIWILTKAKFKNNSDMLLASFGTYNVYIVKKSNEIKNIIIDEGLSHGVYNIANKIIDGYECKQGGLPPILPLKHAGIDTMSAIAAGAYYRTTGAIEKIMHDYDIPKKNLFITGNGATKEILGNFPDAEFENNIVVNALYSWYTDKFGEPKKDK